MILLLHAGVADRTMWREHLEPLAESGHQAIAVDLPGFGDAPVAADRQAPWDEVLKTLRELGVERAVFIGSSFGAAVALRAAVRAPAAVAALMLVSPPPLNLDPSSALQQAWDAEESALASGDIDGAVAAVLDAWLLPNAPKAIRDRVGAMQRKAFELQLSAPEVAQPPDPLDQRPDAIRHLKLPVLAVAGSADMPDFIAGAKEVADLAPHGRLAMIDGAGHLAPLEVPNEFTSLMLEFLSDLE